MMAAATGLDLLKTWHQLTPDDATVFAVGFAVSFAVAWLAVAAFLKVLERVRLTPFALYRFAIAALFAGYFWLAR